MAARGIALREWALHAGDYGTEEEFRAAVVNELAAFEHIGERLGIGLVASPARERVGDSWVTRGWLFATRTVPTIPGADEDRGERPGRLDEMPDPEPYSDVTTFDPVTGRD